MLAPPTGSRLPCGKKSLPCNSKSLTTRCGHGGCQINDQGNADMPAAPAPGDGGVDVRHLLDLDELAGGTWRCPVQDR